MSHTHHEAAGAPVTQQPVPGSGAEKDIEASPATATKAEGGSSDSLPAAPPPRKAPPHGHSHSYHAGAHDHDGDLALPDEDGYERDPRLIVAQLVGVAILEFGIVLHSVIIGLTLAVDDGFRTLFIVLIFHRKRLYPLSLSL